MRHTRKDSAVDSVKRMKDVRFFVFFVCLFVIEVLCSSSLPSEFYQPGPGVILEKWVSSKQYGMDKFNDIPDFPSCPNYISHSETFEYAAVFPYMQQYGRFRTTFVPNQSGKHTFFAIVNNKAKIYIKTNPKGFQKILQHDYAVNDDWNERKWCDEVSLVKGFRYELVVYFYGNGHTPDFFRLGVKFPDNTEVKPIPKGYMRRTMEYYKWNGLIAHKYNNFNFPNWESYSFSYAYTNNPSYPNSPSSFTCKSSLFDPFENQDFGERYALRYIGYMKFPTNGTYSFKMWCNEMCEFFVDKTGVDTKLGSFIIRDYSNPGGITMNGGEFTRNFLYPIKAFVAENVGKDYIRIQHESASSSLNSSWSGMLRNLISVETAKNIPLPIPKMLNSTAISIKLPSRPYLPPRDQWIYIQKHEVLYHRSGVDEPVKIIEINEPLPKTVVATGLNKYTDYVFYAHYYGKINGEDQNIITRYSTVMKTDEDVPETAPPNIVSQARSSTTIKLSWGSLQPLTLWNGIGIGYEVQYKLKSAASDSWKSVQTSGAGTRQYYANSLQKYRFYQFKVAARTIKGSGPLSSIKEERTMEDVPSAAPANITAKNTSSSSISVIWDDVPVEDQNGIITGYRVYLKKFGSPGEWMVEDRNEKTYSKSGLDLWTLYDVKISAKTSVGEGTLSEAVRVRTDEDVPGAPPSSIAATPLSSTSINFTWTDIVEARRYGVILSYKVTYKWTDGEDNEKEMLVYSKYAILSGLAENKNYDVKVAGLTIKGIGVFSSKATMSTLEDVPDAPPTNLRGNFTNSTAIRIHWDVVAEEKRNGIIRKYSVQYKVKGSPSEWKVLSVDAEFMTLHVTNLDYYTMYQFRIAAQTIVGIGPYSNISNIRTDADAPSKPPMNLTGHFLDQRSIQMNWTRIPKEFRHGVIFGYKLHYKDETLVDAPWKNITIANREGGGDEFNETITGLKIYTPYTFRIQAFTYKADGAMSKNVTVWTDEYEPEEAPRNISGVNASSTEIILRWQDMKEIDGGANGKVIGYTIKYRVLDCHEDRPMGCDENKVFNITTNGSLAEIRIPQLRKFTSYVLSVQVFNSKGRGNFSKTINITTDEDKPDEPPTIIETWPSKSDSIDIYWSPIPESHRNGIILGYRVFYKAIDEPQRNYARAPRSVNEFAIYGALPGEKMVQVNSSANQVEIKELKDYSWYQVRIGAFTSKGLGVAFTINGTTQQRSPIEAPELEVIDMYGFEEILLRWKPISRAGARGEVLGYRIQYWLSELHEVSIVEGKKYHFDVLEPNRTIMIERLTPFATYRIRILAFTEGGFGVWSMPKNGETCRCSETLTSAKIILPPLVKAGDLEILPALLDKAVTSCCGNCSHRHGITHVNWAKDSLNSTSVKYTKKGALEAIAAGTNLAVPIFQDSFEMKGDVDKSEYVVVPLLEMDNLVVFQREPSKKELGNAALSILADSLAEQFPLLCISTLLVLLAGVLFWLFERGKNAEEFSNSFAKGSGSGVWLAYITMTTVGYGDLTPITKMGRLQAIVWMLVGTVLTSIIVGNMSSIATINFVIRARSIDQNGKILTSDETLMLASRIYGGKLRLGNTSEGKYVQQSLLSGNVSKVVLDIYSAGKIKDYLTHPKIILEKVETVKASYGVALAGETKRIKKCISRFAKERSRVVLEQARSQSHFYQVADPKERDLVNHMYSIESDFMENTTLIAGVTLSIFVVLGTIYAILRTMRGRSRVKTDVTISEQLSHDVLEEIDNLENKILSNLDRLEAAHTNEIVLLSKMQYAKHMALTSMYPALHLFDSEMPMGRRLDCQTAAHSDVKDPQQNCNISDDEEEYESMPIDYKIDAYC